MKLHLVRKKFTNKSTIGELLVDGRFECYILEDPVREVPGVPVEQWKVHGNTAIPVGTYSVIVNVSTRFKKLLPLLLNVPGYAGVRIHPGNFPEDTEGCLLPGVVQSYNKVLNSRKAFDPLFNKILNARNSNLPVTITIEGLPNAQTH